MATSTKESLGNALKKMLTIKPIDKITVKDLVEECGVNRQTFYYHFDDVYDLLEWVFEEDANRTLPQEILYENWRKNVLTFFHYLYNNNLNGKQHCNQRCKSQQPQKYRYRNTPR